MCTHNYPMAFSDPSEFLDRVHTTRKRRRAFAGVKVLKGVTLGLSEIGTHGPAGFGLFVLDLGLAVLTHRPRVLPVPHDGFSCASE
jgi:hypothetical protein